MDWRLRNWAWLMTAVLLGGCETLPRRGAPSAAPEHGAGTEQTANPSQSVNPPVSWRDPRDSRTTPDVTSQETNAPLLATESPHQSPVQEVRKTPITAAGATSNAPVSPSESTALVPPRPPQVAPPTQSPHDLPLLAVRLAPQRHDAEIAAAIDAPSPRNETGASPPTNAAEVMPSAPAPADAKPVANGSSDDPTATPVAATEKELATPTIPLQAANPVPPEPIRPALFQAPQTGTEDVTLVKFSVKPATAPGTPLGSAREVSPPSDVLALEADRLAPVFPGITPTPPTPLPPATEPAQTRSEPTGNALAPRDSESPIEVRAASGSPPNLSDAPPATPAPPEKTDRPSLVIGPLALCEEIFGFGDFRPYAGAPLKPGQQVLVYAEVRNFTTHQVAGQFETRLSTELNIDAPDGSTIVIPFDDIVDRCKARRSDFYCRYTFKLPEALSPGAHRLRVRIKDHNGGAAAEQTLRVDVAPTR